MGENSIKIKKGSVLIYRVFDIAEAIDQKAVVNILRDHRGPDSFNVPKFIDRALVVKNPPVSFGLGEEVIHLKGQSVKADVMVKIREFGAISFIYQIPIQPGTNWWDLVKLASQLEAGSEIDQLALRQRNEIGNSISSALKEPSNWKSFEDYIIYFIEELEAPGTIKDLLNSAMIPRLLLAENEVVLSERTKKSILDNTYQYGENDLAIVEWNSALVFEPSGGREVPDILEFALTHLLEMRYYDDLLDQRLQMLYDQIESAKNKSLLTGTQFDKLYKDASARYIDFAEFLEKVENSLKVVGDFYLATVYRAAMSRFRLGDWQQSITRKMNILAQVSSLLQGEVNMKRSHLLEIVIILLIALEILSALKLF